MRVFRQAFVGFLLALASGAFGFGCDERAATLPQTLTIDALGQVGLRCELDAARSSVDELHWWCERDVVADGTAGGEVSFEGSGGTHWSCVELAGFEGSGGTHWFCEETGASNVAPGSQGGWDCVETNTENPQSDWTCVPSSRPSEEPACTALSHPPQGLWTDPFEWVSDCSGCANGSAVQTCQAIYVGRVDHVMGNLADLSFAKNDGSGPNATVNYWVLSAPAESLECSVQPLSSMAVRAFGVWPAGEPLLQVKGVPIWESEAALMSAPAGAEQTLALVTGGDDEVAMRRWYQRDGFGFVRACLP
ncbi:MAG: hypothetical protein AUK47_00660 [Deltaproteobacteria bacterium CG2_30_63_29]|nr:MAG: hypothetical protein AUK47_00660 [Deltaproteobacteria bacterium CG2_30_63_29]